jgi:hypothetical protein
MTGYVFHLLDIQLITEKYVNLSFEMSHSAPLRIFVEYLVGLC